MITQKFNQGTHEIKIESAESLEDAKKNNFQEGVYTRFFVDEKFVSSYISLIRFIVDEVKENKSVLIPSNDDLIKKRNEILKENKELIKQEIVKIKKLYNNTPTEELQKNLDSIIAKINDLGIRITE